MRYKSGHQGAGQIRRGVQGVEGDRGAPSWEQIPALDPRVQQRAHRHKNKRFQIPFGVKNAIPRSDKLPTLPRGQSRGWKGVIQEQTRNPKHKNKWVILHKWMSAHLNSIIFS